MSYHFFLISSVSLFSMCGLMFYSYNKIFGEKTYKILKDYKYKNSNIQLISNPQNNICALCFDILEENDEIGRFPKCDHHFCQDCIHQQIDDSQSNLLENPVVLRKKVNPCSMCMV